MYFFLYTGNVLYIVDLNVCHIFEIILCFFFFYSDGFEKMLNINIWRRDISKDAAPCKLLIDSATVTSAIIEHPVCFFFIQNLYCILESLLILLEVYVQLGHTVKTSLVIQT